LKKLRLFDVFFLTDPLFGEIRFAIVAILRMRFVQSIQQQQCNGTVTGTGGAVLETMGSITRRYGNHNGSFFAALKLRWCRFVACLAHSSFVVGKLREHGGTALPAKCRCVWLRAIAKRNAPEQGLFESSNVGSPALET